MSQFPAYNLAEDTTLAADICSPHLRTMVSRREATEYCLAALAMRHDELKAWFDNWCNVDLFNQASEVLDKNKKLESDRAKLVAALKTERGVWLYDKEYSISDYTRITVDQRIETINVALAELGEA